MSRGLKVLFACIGLLIAAFIGVGMSLPERSSLERSVVVDASSSHIYALVANHKNSLQWSPWTEKDPNMSVSYHQGVSGLNATMHWKSNNPDVGTGSSTFIELVENEKVKVSLDFGDMMVSTAELHLRPLDSATEVSWRFEMRHVSYVSRYFGLIIESLVGPDFERGLKNLKRVAEAAPNTVTTALSKDMNKGGNTGE